MTKTSPRKKSSPRASFPRKITSSSRLTPAPCSSGVQRWRPKIHTPDSSRYFYADGYAERLARGEHQKQLSKEFVREWLMANGFQGQAGQQVPEMTPEVVAGITDRYIELYEHITGVPFVKAEDADPAARIEKNIDTFLKSL